MNGIGRAVGCLCLLVFGFALLNFVQAEQDRPPNSPAIIKAEQVQRLQQIHDQEQSVHIHATWGDRISVAQGIGQSALWLLGAAALLALASAMAYVAFRFVGPSLLAAAEKPRVPGTLTITYPSVQPAELPPAYGPLLPQWQPAALTVGQLPALTEPLPESVRALVVELARMGQSERAIVRRLYGDQATCGLAYEQHLGRIAEVMAEAGAQG